MSIAEYKMVLDVPSKAPALGFGQYAQAFTDIIEKSDPQFAIGLFGGWGSGKTTLMQTIEAHLNKDIAIPVRFSAWRYEKEEHLIVPLLDEVRESLLSWSEDHEGGKELAKKTASTIGKAMRSLLAGFSFRFGVPGAMDMTLDANKALAEAEKLDKDELDARLPQSVYHACFRALSDAFGEFIEADRRRRIVVFIDDLDRCLPEGALEVLESMKLFFDLEGFIFVVGLDQRVVEWLIDARYQRSAPTINPVEAEEQLSSYQVRGADYIQKIFQVPFTLAPVAVGQMSNFLRALEVETNLPADQRMELRNRVEPHLHYMVTEAGVNPREVKRYINAYILTLKVKPYLDPDTILALQTVTFRRDWRPVRTALYAWRGFFLDALRRQLDGDVDALANLDSQLGAVPESFLTYVATGAPGAPLLTAHHIDEYIYSGEAARSTQDPALLEAFRHLARVKQKMKELDLDAVVSSDAEVAGPTPTLERIRNDLEAINSTIRVYAKGPIAPLIRRDLDRLRERLSYPPRDANAFRAWREEQISLLADVQNRLMALYDLSSLG